MNINLVDTLRTIADSTKTIANTVTSVGQKTIWQDKALMTAFAVIGGIVLLLAISLFLNREKKPKK
jgi:hypothetical protein